MDSRDRRVETPAVRLRIFAFMSFSASTRAALLSLSVAFAPACDDASRDGSEPTVRTTQALGSNAAAPGSWIGTWAASPQIGNAIFSRQTLRQIVHTSIAGAVARIQLSNAFGTQPLYVSDVHIAQSTYGSSIAAGTDRSVKFGGQTATSIAPGELAMSDPIAFPVAALSDVAISFYLPQPTGPATTGHSTALQTNYVAIGDVSANVTLAGVAQMGAYYFIANLDVRNPAAEGAIVTLGASITDGIASAPNSNRRWPNDLAVRLTNGGRTIGVLNQGISGNQLLTDGAGQAGLHRFQRDVLSQPGVRWVICSDDPINDLGSGNPPSSDRLIAGLEQIISTAHQDGVKFVCSTLTPFYGSAGWTPRGETARAAFNAFVRSAASGCDGIVDQEVATHDPANAIRYLPAYDSGDHLHPNVAGLQAIANSVNLKLFAGSAGNPGDGGSGAAGAIADSGGGGSSSGGGASNDSGGNAGDSGADGSGVGGGMRVSIGGSGASSSGAGAGSGAVTASSNASQQGAGDAAVAGGRPVGASGCASAAGSDRPAPSAFAALAFGLSLAFARRRRIGRRKREKRPRSLEQLETGEPV